MEAERLRWAQEDRRGRFVYLCFKLFCFQPLEGALDRSLQCLLLILDFQRIVINYSRLEGRI